MTFPHSSLGLCAPPRKTVPLPNISPYQAAMDRFPPAPPVAFASLQQDPSYASNGHAGYAPSSFLDHLLFPPNLFPRCTTFEDVFGISAATASALGILNDAPTDPQESMFDRSETTFSFPLLAPPTFEPSPPSKPSVLPTPDPSPIRRPFTLPHTPKPTSRRCSSPTFAIPHPFRTPHRPSYGHLLSSASSSASSPSATLYAPSPASTLCAESPYPTFKLALPTPSPSKDFTILPSPSPAPMELLDDSEHSFIRRKPRRPIPPKTLPCPDPSCPLVFARHHDLRRHTTVHSGATPFTCHGCQRGFKRSDARTRHWRVYGNEGCKEAHADYMASLPEDMQEGKRRRRYQVTAKVTQAYPDAKPFVFRSSPMQLGVVAPEPARRGSVNPAITFVAPSTPPKSSVSLAPTKSSSSGSNFNTILENYISTLPSSALQLSMDDSEWFLNP